MKNKQLCPCGSGLPEKACCEPILCGDTQADSPEALMRSRYTAYSKRNTTYLLDSWHPSSRPETLELEAGIKWFKLDIIQAHDNMVEFCARYRIQGKAGKLHEVSEFVFENGHWYYMKGI